MHINRSRSLSFSATLCYEFGEYRPLEASKAAHALVSRPQVNCVRLHSGKLLSASDDFSLRVWDMSTLTCLTVLEGHNAEVCVRAEAARIPHARTRSFGQGTGFALCGFGCAVFCLKAALAAH